MSKVCFFITEQKHKAKRGKKIDKYHCWEVLYYTKKPPFLGWLS